DAVDLAVGGDGGAGVVATELGERAGEVGGGGGEHGSDRLEDRGPELLEGRGAAGERGAGDGTGERAEHRGAADRRDRDLGGVRDGLDEEGVEGALADLAEDEAAEVLLLGLGEGAEQGGHGGGPAGLRPGTGKRGDALELLVDLRGGERGGGGGRREVGKGAPADAGAALADAAGEVGGDDVDLVGLRLAERRREERALLQPGARGGDGGGGLGDAREEHAA